MCGRVEISGGARWNFCKFSRDAGGDVPIPEQGVSHRSENSLNKLSNFEIKVSIKISVI